MFIHIVVLPLLLLCRFMQQMQQMEAELAAVTGQVQPRSAQQEALLRNVGCQRLKNGALREYQVRDLWHGAWEAYLHRREFCHVTS
jgi:hypothetical protein